MAKYIDIESFFNKHNNEIAICGRGSSGKQRFINFITELVNEPPVDVVDVVRCKDCVNFDKEKRFCCLHKLMFFSSDFCNYGEKKDKEDK